MFPCFSERAGVKPRPPLAHQQGGAGRRAEDAEPLLLLLPT